MVHIVFNMITGAEIKYCGCTAKEAVIAAFAQDRGDWNSWDYETRYAHLVQHGHWHFFCGDFAVRFAKAV
jgi:hypothetical protein